MVSFRARQSVEEPEAVRLVSAFRQALLADASLAASASFELKKNIVIMKIRLSERHNHQLVEIIFKLVLNPSLPKNEDIMADYIKLYPISRPIYLVFRTVLHRAGLDDPSAGGINSLAVFLMIIGFLQKIDSMTGQPDAPGADPGDLPPALEPSLRSLHSQSSRTPERGDTPLLLSMDRAGKIVLNMVYFYGFSFDYLDNYIHPCVSKESRCNSFFQVG